MGFSLAATSSCVAYAHSIVDIQSLHYVLGFSYVFSANNPFSIRAKFLHSRAVVRFAKFHFESGIKSEL